MGEGAAARRHLATLDAVRALGALMVVLTHCGFQTGEINDGWWGWILWRCDAGVALFFVVSGFLLARPWLAAKATGTPLPATGRYLRKRALRILPLYWVVVVAALLVDPDNRHVGVGVWLTHLTLTQLYVTHPLAGSLTQMWSLCTEVAFYLLLPVLMRLLSPGRTFSWRRTVTGCGVLAAGGLAWTASVGSWSDGFRHQAQWLPGYLPWFAIGVAFAACAVAPGVRRRLEAVAVDTLGWWLLAAALFAVACTPIAGPRTFDLLTPWQAVLKCALYGAAAGCVTFPLIFGPEDVGLIRTMLTSRPAVFLGRISYGIFAIDMIVLVLGMRVLGLPIFGGHFWLVLVTTLSVTIALAAISYRWLESPFLRLKDGRTPPATAAEAAPTAPSAHV